MTLRFKDRKTDAELLDRLSVTCEVAATEGIEALLYLGTAGRSRATRCTRLMDPCAGTAGDVADLLQICCDSLHIADLPGAFVAVIEGVA